MPAGRARRRQWRGNFFAGANCRAPGDETQGQRAGKPQYPELAKKLGLSDLMKIEVSIGPDGQVKKTHIVGGHPVLATEAEKAALQSRFEPGPKEATEIEFKFSSS
jgi:TonB family protein